MTDLFNAPVVDVAPPAPIVPPGRYRVRLGAVEILTSEGRGTMRRLSATIVGGPHHGAVVYKMLTDDVKGFDWLQHAVSKLKRWSHVPRTSNVTNWTSLGVALVGTDCIATVYHYHHRPTSTVYPTIKEVSL